MKLVQEGIDANRDKLVAATRALGLAPKQAEAVEQATVSILGRLPVAIALLDEIDEVVEQMQNGIFSLRDASELLDSMITLAKKIIGRPTCVKLFHPFAVAIVDEIMAQLPFKMDEKNHERCRVLAVRIAQYMVGNGLRVFMSKWIPVMEGTPSYRTVDDMFLKIDEVYGINNEKLSRLSMVDLDDEDTMEDGEDDE